MKKKVKALAKKKVKASRSDFIGRCFLFRTASYHILGRVKRVADVCGTNFFELETGSSWVADSGRFSEAMNNGSLCEVEVIKKPNHLVNPAACSDILEWHHELPTETK